MNKLNEPTSTHNADKSSSNAPKPNAMPKQAGEPASKPAADPAGKEHQQPMNKPATPAMQQPGAHDPVQKPLQAAESCHGEGELQADSHEKASGQKQK